MGYAGLFRSAGVMIQLEERVGVFSVVITFEPAAPHTYVGAAAELLAGCRRAVVDFSMRQEARAFARRAALALGIAGGAYGEGLDIMKVVPPQEPATEPDAP